VNAMEVAVGLNGDQPLKTGPTNSSFSCPANHPLPTCQIPKGHGLKNHMIAVLPVSIWTSKKQNVLIDKIITHQLIKYFCGSLAFMSFFYKKKIAQYHKQDTQTITIENLFSKITRFYKTCRTPHARL